MNRLLAVIVTLHLMCTWATVSAQQCPAVDFPTATAQAKSWFEDNAGMPCKYHAFLKNVLLCGKDLSAPIYSVEVFPHFEGGSTPVTHYMDVYDIHSDGSQSCYGRLYCNMCSNLCGTVDDLPGCG
jgi:hypothetical protein